MRGAALVALAAALGNMLQGWDNATIAGSLLYIKREFGLDAQPALEGLVVATSLIGATVVTTFSETAPPEIRGTINTLPQFTGSTGMFLSYCMVFAMTLAPSPDWRVMLGVLFLPSLLYIAVAVLYLPESPRWLVSKGRMREARAVLQMLRDREDVDGEMALLAEGLGSGGVTAIEEFGGKSGVTLFGPERGMPWVAQPVPLGGQGSMLGSAMGQSRQGSLLGSAKGLSRMGSMLGSAMGQSRQGSLLGSAMGLSRMGSLLDNLQDPVVADGHHAQIDRFYLFLCDEQSHGKEIHLLPLASQ